MSKDPEPLPPLPEPLRFAVAALRSTKPSEALAQKVQHALAVAPRAPAARPRRGARPWQLVAVAAATSVGLGAYVRLRARHASAPVTAASTMLRVHHLEVQLPTQGEAWVALPWRGDAHGGQSAEVHVEAPAQLAVRSASEDRHRVCSQHTCLHRWTAHASGLGHLPMHVQISHPGRYEFRVTHASRSHMLHDHIVVLASR